MNVDSAKSIGADELIEQNLTGPSNELDEDMITVAVKFLSVAMFCRIEKATNYSKDIRDFIC